MTWDKMLKHEPELIHLEHSARRARQQAASWYDWWSEHNAQLAHILSFQPGFFLAGNTVARDWASDL